MLLTAVKDHNPPEGYLSEHLHADKENPDIIEYRLFVGKTGRKEWFIGAGLPPPNDQILVVGYSPAPPSPASPSPASPSPTRKGKVDFLLCPPAGTAGNRMTHRLKLVDEVHARFSIHPLSGALMISSESPEPTVFYQRALSAEPSKQRFCDDDDNELYRNEDYRGPKVLLRQYSTCVTRPFCTPKTLIKIGPYKFLVLYHQTAGRNPGPLDWRDARDQLTNYSMGLYLSRHLAPFPLPTHSTLDDYRLHRLVETPHGYLPRLGRGDGHVGVHLLTGQPMLIRERHYTSDTFEYVSDEIMALEQLGGAVSTGVVGLVKTWCNHSSPPCRAVSEGMAPVEPDLVYYSMPLPEYHFATMPWTGIETTARLRYFYETLTGLGMIHHKSVIHRDIRPNNLLLFSYHRHDDDKNGTPPMAATPDNNHPLDLLQAAISITNHTFKGSSCRNKHTDPNHWMAPEFLTCSSQRPYSYGVDVYALARCWLDTFGRTRLDEPSPDTSEQNHVRVRLALGQLKAMQFAHEIQVLLSPLSGLMEQMLAYDPNTRPTVTDALSHRAWRPIRRAFYGEMLSETEHESDAEDDARDDGKSDDATNDDAKSDTGSESGAEDPSNHEQSNMNGDANEEDDTNPNTGENGDPWRLFGREGNLYPIMYSDWDSDESGEREEENERPLKRARYSSPVPDTQV